MQKSLECHEINIYFSDEKDWPTRTLMWETATVGCVKAWLYAPDWEIVLVRPGEKESLSDEVLLTELGLGSDDGCHLRYYLFEKEVEEGSRTLDKRWRRCRRCYMPH